MEKIKLSLDWNTLIILLFTLSFLLIIYSIFNKNQNLLYLGCSIAFLTIGMKILEGKGKTFLGDSEYRFLNNPQARKKLYLYRAVLLFLLALLYFGSIFIKISYDVFSYTNIGLLILAILISLFYLYKYRK